MQEVGNVAFQIYLLIYVFMYWFRWLVWSSIISTQALTSFWTLASMALVIGLTTLLPASDGSCKSTENIRLFCLYQLWLTETVPNLQKSFPYLNQPELEMQVLCMQSISSIIYMIFFTERRNWKYDPPFNNSMTAILWTAEHWVTPDSNRIIRLVER